MGKTPQRKLKINAKARKKRLADPAKQEAERLYQQQYRIDNKEKIAEQQSQRQKDLSVEIRLQRKQLNSEELASHVRNHPGLCDLCSNPPDGKWKQLNIDHSHTTGEFRGMLCSNCNRALGYFLDNAALMRKAADYIEGSYRVAVAKHEKIDITLEEIFAP